MTSLCRLLMYFAAGYAIYNISGMMMVKSQPNLQPAAQPSSSPIESVSPVPTVEGKNQK